MPEKLDIEQLFRTRLDGAELSPSPAAWKGIQRQLRWKQFLRFRPGKFNLYYAGALLIAATGLVVLLTAEKGRAERSTAGDPGIALSPSGSSANEGDRTAPGLAIHDNRSREDRAETAGAYAPTEADRGREGELQDSGSIAQRSETFLKNLTETVPIALEPGVAGETQAVPASNFTSSIQSGCAPLTVQFTDRSMHAGASLWDFGTGEVSREKNPVYEFKEAGRYVVSLTTENHGKLPTTSRMMIEVLAAPVADFLIEEGLEGVDMHVVLNLVNYSSNGSVYAWNLVDEACVSCNGWSSIEHQPTLELNSITPDSRSVRLEVINEHGCSDTAVQPLPLIVQSSETRIKFPTAFSPNPSGPGDGSFAPGSRRIDLFHPVYLEVPVEFHMRVYTRRGELVFETRELFRGWDGYLLQEQAKSDVYVWMAEGKYKDGEAFSLRGDVTVVRNKYW